MAINRRSICSLFTRFPAEGGRGILGWPEGDDHWHKQGLLTLQGGLTRPKIDTDLR